MCDWWDVQFDLVVVCVEMFVLQLMKWIGCLEEVVMMVVFLVFDEVLFINVVCIIVDGGCVVLYYD